VYSLIAVQVGSVACMTPTGDMGKGESGGRRMRHIKGVLGVAALVCAFALMASPTLAAEFTASRIPELSEASPGKTTGRSVGGEFAQVFRFGAFQIKCDKATGYAKTVAEGAVTWSTSKIFATEMKFGKCLTVAKFTGFTAGLGTRFNNGNPIKIVYHVNGFAEFGSGETLTEVEVGSGEAGFKISGKICTISWPAQTVPAKAIKEPEGEFSSAVYSNKYVAVPESQFKKYPGPEHEHEQQRLVIANEWKKMTWEYQEGQCVGEGGFEEEAKKVEGKEGQYLGTIDRK